MEWFIRNISIINVIISVINISVILWKWQLSRPRLEFYTPNESFFIKSTPKIYGYTDSECIVFYHIKIANLSSLPCTISEFALMLDRCPIAYYRSNTKIFDEYTLKEDIHKTITIKSDQVLRLPCTLPPFGYAEGVLVFPYSPYFNCDKVFVEVSVRTSKKTFITGDFIKKP